MRATFYRVSAVQEGGMNNGSKRKRPWVFWGGIALVVISAGVGIAAMRPNRPIDPSKLATIEKGDIAKSVVATGKIEPLTKVQVKSKASGIVKKLLADYGEVVKEGQILVELDK